nr:MAG TPA: hypothetical protein [Caudoviricetes sp.]
MRNLSNGRFSIKISAISIKFSRYSFLTAIRSSRIIATKR